MLESLPLCLQQCVSEYIGECDCYRVKQVLQVSAQSARYPSFFDSRDFKQFGKDLEFVDQGWLKYNSGSLRQQGSL